MPADDVFAADLAVGVTAECLFQFAFPRDGFVTAGFFVGVAAGNVRFPNKCLEQRLSFDSNCLEIRAHHKHLK